jgi:hypothetical protein
VSNTGKNIQSDSENTDKLIKSVNFLAGEVGTFKEALNNNISNANGTLGITNKSIKELRVTLDDSTQKIIASSQKLADSQNKFSLGMFYLTFLLVIVGIGQVGVGIFQIKVTRQQAIIMQNQSEIMKSQAEYSKKLAEFELSPTIEIESKTANYLAKDLTFYYVLVNSGKSKVLDINRCHSLDLIDRSTSKEMRLKQESCMHNKHDLTLLPDRSTIVHQDNIGDYHLDLSNPNEYLRINLKVDYKTEQFLGKNCSVSRSFDLIPSEKDFLLRPSSYPETLCN